MGLPPNSVGGELDLEEAALVWEDLADAAVSQRCRKRVTSSWSSIVFMCLMEGKHEGRKVETTTCLCEKKRYFKITWTRHSTTSSSWTSWPETSSSRQCDPAAPAGTSSGALWLGPTSAAEDGRRRFGQEVVPTTKPLTRTETYLLLSQLEVWTGSMREEVDAGHGRTHVILSRF